MEQVARPGHDRAEGAIGGAEAREPRRDADVGATAAARFAPAARVGRVGGDALPGPWPVEDHAAELVAEHERTDQARVADPGLGDTSAGPSRTARRP